MLFRSEGFAIPNRPVTRSMDFNQDNVDVESSDSDEASPSLNPQAAPFVPLAQDDQASEDDVPSSPRASTSQVDPVSPPRIHSMVKAHPPSQMLSSTTSGIRTRSSYENLIANQAFVSLIEPKSIKEALIDPDWVRWCGAAARPSC